MFSKSPQPAFGNFSFIYKFAPRNRGLDRDLLLLSGVSFMQRRKAESRSPLPSCLNIVSVAVCYRVHVRGAHKIDSHVQLVVLSRNVFFFTSKKRIFWCVMQMVMALSL